MISKRVNSIDVARLAGVSQSTVSRTFNPGANVSLATRSKVLVAARELGYKPNAIARSLITRSTCLVGIVTTYKISSPFYANVLQKFIQNLADIDRRVLLFNVDPDQDIDDIIPLVLEYQVDALIMIAATMSSTMVEECTKNGTPVILFNQYLAGSGASAVCADNIEAGRLAASFFLDTGHQHLAYMAGIDDTWATLDRERGFSERLRERGQPEWVREQGDLSYQSGYEAARRLLQRADPPDAIFCANDGMAQGVLDLARLEFGIKLPEELSVIGHDDLSTSGQAAYSLTTIRPPLNQMIKATLELLIERMATPEMEPVIKLFPGRLIERDSTRALDSS